MVLKDLGAKVEPVSIPLMTKMQGVHTAVCDSQAASYHRRRLRESYDLYDYNTRVRIMVGALIPAGLATLAQRAKARFGQTLLEKFTGFDLLFGATGTGPAGLIVTEPAIKSAKDARAAVAGRGGGSSLFSMAGVPAISIPAGFTKEGLPVGWHLAARPFDEATLLRCGHAYQMVTDHHRHHPAMAWADDEGDPTTPLVNAVQHRA
jgi:aspartyl-tRNA(Asn)/glutamyl-tRNA(Gln) amidotransferase subunit A